MFAPYLCALLQSEERDANDIALGKRAASIRFRLCIKRDEKEAGGRGGRGVSAIAVIGTKVTTHGGGLFALARGILVSFIAT